MNVKEKPLIMWKGLRDGRYQENRGGNITKAYSV